MNFILKNKYIIILLIIIIIVIKQTNQKDLTANRVGFLPFPSLYDSATQTETKFYYFLGSQNSDEAYRFIINFIGNYKFDSTKSCAMYFLKYKEGLLTSAPYSHSFFREGSLDKLTIFSFGIGNFSNDNIGLTRNDNGNIIAECRILKSEFYSENRDRIIHKSWKYFDGRD